MMRNFDSLQSEIGAFGIYQLRVFLATQFACISMQASLLCTVFDTIRPRNVNCSLPQMEVQNATKEAWNSVGFKSLILELDLICAHNYIPTLMSTAVMVGATAGAGVCGFLADTYGRRPVVLGTLLFSILLNLFIAAFGAFNWILDIVLFFILGFFVEGYLVTHFTALLELIGSQFRRLCVTAFNGLPLGLMSMGLIGYLMRHWKWFHLAAAAAGVPFFPLLVWCLDESPKWLAQTGNIRKAATVFAKIGRVNRTEMDVGRLKESLHHLTARKESVAVHTYGYMDLFRHRTVWRYLMPLCYSWFASAVIMYGLYFNLGTLPGDLYFNLFMTGLIKGASGVTPFLVGRWVGRKPVLMMSVMATCLVLWASVILHFVTVGGKTHWATTMLLVLGVGAVDPVWKVNHFYSTELFPTVVRSMARGVCNVGGRIGGILAPQILYLQIIHFSLPFSIFGIVSVFHVVVCALFLPETKGRPICESLLEVENENFAGKCVINGPKMHAINLYELKFEKEIGSIENDETRTFLRNSQIKTDC